jgi:hypothetical protein
MSDGGPGIAARPRERRGRTAGGLFALIALLTLLGVSRSVWAQDSHYWSEQYGTRSNLLGGAVVGSPQDLSTTFYNPAGLAWMKTESFLLSARAFEFQSLRIQEDGGTFTDLTSDKLGTAPSLFAGTFPRNWVTGTLAYSFLTRQRFDFRFNNWQTDPSAVSGDSVTTNLFLDAKVSEDWGGLTWSRPVGEVGVGVTLYGAYRSQRGRSEILSQPTSSGDPGVAGTTVNDYRYSHFRMLAKVGVYWEWDRASVGVTFTTPGLGLFGSGKASYYRSLVPTDPDVVVSAVTESYVENDLSADYQSPASVAIGGRYAFGRNALYIAAEWFDAVEAHRVMDAPGLPASGVGSTLTSTLTQEARSVLNLALGYEYSPRQGLTFYGSFLTDASSHTDNPDASHSFSTWDIYQFTGGAAFTFMNTDFTLGLSFGGGEEALGFQADNATEPVLESGKVRYRRVKLFIGFEFGTEG